MADDTCDSLGSRMVYSAVQLVRERGVTARPASGTWSSVPRPRADRSSTTSRAARTSSSPRPFSGSGTSPAQWVADYAGKARRRPTPSGLFAHVVGVLEARVRDPRVRARLPGAMATAADLAAVTRAVTRAAARTALGRLGGRDRRRAGPDGRPGPARAPAGDADAAHRWRGRSCSSRVHRDVRPLTTVVAELARCWTRRRRLALNAVGRPGPTALKAGRSGPGRRPWARVGRGQPEARGPGSVGPGSEAGRSGRGVAGPYGPRGRG